MTVVAPDMIRIDQDSAVLRPMRSPMLPQTMPPIGRMTKESAKTAKVASSAACGAISGKKTAAITVAK